MSDCIEIRWHGRGGQGAVTASELLAETALEEDKHFQAFPEYGPERMGAPVRAYTRISTGPIRQHCPITDPDVVVVLDPTLIGVVDVTDGLKEHGILVVNTHLSPADMRERLHMDGRRVFTVDASRIARDTIGRNTPNTAILGALLKATEVVNRDDVITGIRNRLGPRVGAKTAEANVDALNQAYQEAKEG